MPISARIAIATLCITALCRPRRLNADETQRYSDADGYVVYSQLFKDSGRPSAKEDIGIYVFPLPVTKRVYCEPALQGEEQELLAAAQVAGQRSAVWDQQISFGHSVQFILPLEMHQAQACIADRRSGTKLPGCRNYAKLQSIRFLSVPIFNSDRSRVLVATNQICRKTCEGFRVRIYRRTASGWQQQPNGPACAEHNIK